MAQQPIPTIVIVEPDSGTNYRSGVSKSTGKPWSWTELTVSLLIGGRYPIEHTLRLDTENGPATYAPGKYLLAAGSVKEISKATAGGFVQKSLVIGDAVLLPIKDAMAGLMDLVKADEAQARPRAVAAG